MTHLGSIPITRSESSREARNKIRRVVETLVGDTVLATRLATSTSEMARSLLREAAAPRIDVDLHFHDRRYDLALTFSGHHWAPRTELLSKFFDEVQRVRPASGQAAVRAICYLPLASPPDPQRLNALSGIVQKKGRDQLMAELEEHRAHLEQTVQERTAQLEDAMAEAKSANTAKSQFLANMSHELRTPMNAIIGYTEMLMEEAEDLDQEDFIPDLQRIHSAGNHLLALINDVLDLSKIEAGKMELFAETFEVQPLIDEIATTVDGLVKKNNNTLRLECDPGLGAMFSDVTKIRQSLFNLLSNACKFTENGAVTLSARRDDSGWLTFRVADSGIGIAKEKLGRLFGDPASGISTSTCVVAATR